MKKNCKHFMDIFLQLDKHQHMPFALSWHLLTCSKCRTEIALLSKTEKMLANEYSDPVLLSNNTLATLMKQIDPTFVAKEQNKMPYVSMKKWIFSGIFIVFAMIIFGIFAKESMRQGVYIASTATFAIVSTGFCGFFVASNLDLFVKKIEKTPLLQKLYSVTY